MKILTYPNDQKLLRTKGEPVTREMFDTPEFMQKLNEMTTLAKQDGIGLAATQVGWPVQLFLILVDESMQLVEPRIVLNPEIHETSKETVKETEGCLSFPGLPLTLERPASIRWSYESLTGGRVEAKAEGFYARVLMHEIDHLNGKLFVDGASSAQRLAFERWLKKRGK